MTKELTFPHGFASRVLEGDTITLEHEGLVIRARVYRDDDTSKPDKRGDGFWPSQDPANPGYVLPENYESEMAKAKRAMSTFKRGEWFYCGIAVTVWKDGKTCLTGPYDAALWGIECNYPDSDNAYLTEVANELIGEALSAAKIKAA